MSHSTIADAADQAPDKPFVSVIVPVFKDVQGLWRLLASLCHQTLTDFEVIVVDNGSAPPISINGDHALRIRLLRCPTPGSYAARNVGAAAAMGTALAFIDADCFADSQWLETGLSRLASQRGISLVGGEVLFTDPTPRNGISLYQTAVGFQQEANIHRHGFSATANLFCTSEQFHCVGPFDERLLSGGDREWAWRAATLGFGIVFEPTCIVLTPPRTSWLSAIRQSRRVAAGRLHLRKHALSHAGPGALKPHRNIGQSVLWLLQHDGLNRWEKLAVGCAAIVLKVVALVESLRVRLGFQAERR